MKRLYLGVVAAALGIGDALITVQLLARGGFREVGLPALVWGPYPSPVELLGGAVALVLLLLWLGHVLPTRWGWRLYATWALIETYEVVRGLVLAFTS